MLWRRYVDCHGNAFTETNGGVDAGRVLTAGDLIKYYCGEIGITISEFNESTLQELSYIGEGFRIREQKEWSRTRALMTMIVNGYAKKRIKPTDLFELDIDKKPIIKSDPKKVKEVFEKADKQKEFFEFLKKKNGNGSK